MKLKELVALTRYHYNKTWEKDWTNGRDGLSKWTKRCERHSQALNSCISLMKQFGFHGFGKPSDDNGIVIFFPDRMILEELIAFIPHNDHNKLAYNEDFDSITLQELRTKYSTSIEDLKGRTKHSS